MTPTQSRIPWREKPTQSVPATSDIGGWSNGHTYNLIGEGKLTAVRVANKTAVLTESLIQLLNAAEPWTSNKARVAAANHARLKSRASVINHYPQHSGDRRRRSTRKPGPSKPTSDSKRNT
jgi:hypothetical protein